MGNDSPALQAIAAEEAVLGASLLDMEAAGLACESLRRSDYVQERHQHISEAIRAVISTGERPDLLTVTRQLLRRNQDGGGPVYLAGLVDAIVTTANVRAHCRLVKEASLRRHIRAVCLRTIQAMEDPGASPPESVAHLCEDVQDGGDYQEEKTVTPAKLSDTLRLWMAQVDTGERPRRIPTHLPTLNRCLGGGLAPGRLYYLGARPSVGKTSLAIDIARHAGKQGHASLIVSLEMPEVDGITTRALSQESQVSELVIRSGLLPSVEYSRMVTGYNSLSALPVWVTDKATRITDVERCVDRWPFSPPLSLLIVDYLQLLRGPKSESRRMEVEEISRALKLLAVRCGLPVICISALRRRESDDGRPTMSDLKETGELEYDGDAILLLHRGFGASEAELILAKNKYGPVGTVPLIFKRDYVSFSQAEEAA